MCPAAYAEQAFVTWGRPQERHGASKQPLNVCIGHDRTNAILRVRA
ncbi:hypothetical protein CT19431_240062 [Cupriavidus taiwanensis]|nr:hypothetical protein CT19431_240062 [Cupriavidus taiwanensis]